MRAAARSIQAAMTPERTMAAPLQGCIERALPELGAFGGRVQPERDHVRIRKRSEFSVQRNRDVLERRVVLSNDDGSPVSDAAEFVELSRFFFGRSHGSALRRARRNDVLVPARFLRMLRRKRRTVSRGRRRRRDLGLRRARIGMSHAATEARHDVLARRTSMRLLAVCTRDGRERRLPKRCVARRAVRLRALV